MQGTRYEREMCFRANREHADNNIYRRPLQKLLLEEPYRSLYRSAWEAGTNPVCIKKCGLVRRSTRRKL